MDVLSIDGGGIRGIVSTLFLQDLESALASRLADTFDLVVGVSTGGLLAVAVAARLPMTELRRFYDRCVEDVLSRPRLRDSMRSWYRPKYPAEPLAQALRGLFGDTALCDLSIRVAVPVLDLSAGRPLILRSYATDEGPASDWPCADAVLAGMALPTLLPAFERADRGLIIDIGIVANDPTLLAIAESLRLRSAGLPELRVVSVGSGREPSSIDRRRAVRGGKSFWIRNGNALARSTQVEYSQTVARQFLAPGTLVRFDPMLPRRSRAMHSYVRDLEARTSAASSAVASSTARMLSTRSSGTPDHGEQREAN